MWVLMGVGGLVWVVLLIVLVIVLVAALILPTIHVASKQGTPANSFSAPTPISPPINTSLNTPIYVIGPQSLTQRLINTGIPQSLIRPIGLSQLLGLPNNSIAVVDWSVIKPYVSYSTVGGSITLNLTSPAVELLAGLFAKGDLVIINVSRVEAPIAELLLSYTIAKGAGIALHGSNGIHQYLVPMLEMPINSNHTLIGATAIRTRNGVAVLIGPVNLKGLPNLIKNWLQSIETAKGLIKLPTTNQDPSYQNEDPCTVTYQNFLGGPQGSGGVYTSGNFIFLWGMQSLESLGALGAWNLGVEAIQDNYGDMFYYDSCISMYNFVANPSPPYIPAELMGDVAYTMASNGLVPLSMLGDFDMYTSYEMLNSGWYNAYIALTGADYYEPQSTLSTTSYSISVGWPASVSVSFNAPSSEQISVATTPYATTPYNFFAFNLTWTFTYNYPSTLSGPSTFVNGFIAGQDGSAPITPTNYSPGATYWLYLPFNAEVTAGIQYDVYYDPCWSAWANTVWVVGLTASSSNAISINTAYYNLTSTQSNVPSGSWISGYSIPQICSGISLSGP